MGFLALRKHNVTLCDVYAKKPESYCAPVVDIFGKGIDALIRFRSSSVDGQNAAKTFSKHGLKHLTRFQETEDGEMKLHHFKSGIAFNNSNNNNNRNIIPVVTIAFI